LLRPCKAAAEKARYGIKDSEKGYNPYWWWPESAKIDKYII
jgi:hypothetical protein